MITTPADRRRHGRPRAQVYVRDALDHIDPDVSYPLWRDIGFALADHFGSDTTAESVFKDWSRSGTKWDDDAEDQAERIIDHADDGGGRTIGTVIYHARQGGWDLPTTTATADGGTATLNPSNTPNGRPDRRRFPSIRGAFTRSPDSATTAILAISMTARKPPVSGS